MNKPRPPDHQTEGEKYRLKQLENLPHLKKRKVLHIENSYPHFLYKYIGHNTKVDYLRSLLIDSDFYLSSCSQFNDPFDTTAEIIKVENVQTLRKKLSLLIQKKNPQLSKLEQEKLVTSAMVNIHSNPNYDYEILKKNMQRAGLFCLTENPKNILMWSHYASNHEGMALQFKVSNDIRSMLYALKIHYSKEYPKWSVTDYDNMVEEILLRKSTDWAYEEEWRILRIGGKGTFQPFKPETLSGVIFGCRVDEGFKKDVLAILEERRSIYKCEVKTYSAEMHKSSYRINVFKDS